MAWWWTARACVIAWLQSLCTTASGIARFGKVSKKGSWRTAKERVFVPCTMAITLRSVRRGRYGTQIALSLPNEGPKSSPWMQTWPGRIAERRRPRSPWTPQTKKNTMAQHGRPRRRGGHWGKFEATVLTTSTSWTLGCLVIVRANDANQERILRSLGVTDIFAARKRGGRSGQRATHQPQHSRLFDPSGRLRNRRNQSPRGVSWTSIGRPGFGQPVRVALITIRREFKETGTTAPCRGTHLGRAQARHHHWATDTLVVFTPSTVQRFTSTADFVERRPLNPAATPFPLPSRPSATE